MHNWKQPPGGTAEPVSAEAERRQRGAARRHAVLMVLGAAAVFSSPARW
ncbi:hypothetical protein ACFQY5_24010 [Paeniroseomonas aquatica]